MKKKTILRICALLPFPAALGMRLYARHHAGAVERLFAEGPYPAIAAAISRLTALCPMPVVELALPALLTFMIHSLRRRRVFRVATVWLLCAAVFVGGWGLSYLRVPLEETLGLPVRASSAGELAALCEALVADVNAYHSAPDGDILAAAPAALDMAVRDWPIPSGGFAAPKYALSSPILSRLLIEGIVSPFTLEGLVNRRIPDVSKPFAACHEAAHVRGFGREEDASLVAYLACMASEEPFFRYSGAFTALLYALSALRDADSTAYDACRAMINRDVWTDIAAHAAFWDAYEDTGPAEISTAVNDVYLQAVSGGAESMRSYGRLVDLLLALHRKEGTRP